MFKKPLTLPMKPPWPAVGPCDEFRVGEVSVSSGRSVGSMGRDSITTMYSVSAAYFSSIWERERV